jgi:hypothetical protein
MATGCTTGSVKRIFFGDGKSPSCLRSSSDVVGGWSITRESRWGVVATGSDRKEREEDNGVGKSVLAIAVVSGVSPREGSAEVCLPTSCPSAAGCGPDQGNAVPM